MTEEYELRVADLNAIESRVIGWLSGCTRLNNVFAQGLDPYKDFATVLFNVPYDKVTRKQRNDSKPGVLGCGFRLGGGDLVEGKKTGLWGYAEKMGVNLTREFCHQAVDLFRDETYPEIPPLWYALEKAARQCMETGKPAKAGEWLTFERRAPYLMLRLPSGRYIYYFQPKMVKLWFAKHPRTGQMKPLGQDEARAENAKAKGWEVYSKINLSYMGKPQNKPGWVRLPTHGGKLTENAVQSVARDVLKEGMLAAADFGFQIVGTVYDEIITLQPKSDTERSCAELQRVMTAPIPWAPGLLLDSASWAGPFYRKD